MSTTYTFAHFDKELRVIFTNNNLLQYETIIVAKIHSTEHMIRIPNDSGVTEKYQMLCPELIS